MAAVTSAGVGAGDTSNANPYTTASFTPSAGDLLIFIAYLAGTTDAAFTASASANGITLTRSIQFLGDAGGKRAVVFIADQLVPSSPSSMTLTVDNAPTDAATGCVYEVLRISGMTAVGSAAVVQTAGADSNMTASDTPTVTFASAPDAGNPVIGVVCNNTNPATQTAPGSFTERADLGFTTPNTGLEVVSIDASSPTTLTWGSTSTRGVVFAFELDASGGGGLGGTLGITTETDTAQSFGKRKSKSLNISAETDAAQALGRQKSKSLNISTETDEAQPVGRRKVKALGTATETDTALPITPLGDLGGALGTATEVDEAQPLSRTKLKALGAVSETDAAQSLGRRKVKAVGTATETDAAQSFSRTKVKVIGVVTETDEALEITGNLGTALTAEVGTATETDEAQPLARTKRKAVGTASEVDTAVALSGGLATVTYSPPTYEKPIRIPSRHILNYYTLTHAASIVKVNGVFTAIVTPNPDLLEGLEEGVDYFRGGYLYEMTQAQAAELAAAGFPSS